jgi:hypothetical protein
MAIDREALKRAPDEALRKALLDPLVSAEDKKVVRVEIVARTKGAGAARQRADAQALRLGLQRGTGATGLGIAARQRAERQAAAQKEHQKWLANEFGTGYRAEPPPNVTLGDFGRRVLGGLGTAVGGVEAAVGAGGRGLANLLGGDSKLDPQEQALEDEHQKYIRKEYGTGEDLPFRTTFSEGLPRLFESVGRGFKEGYIPSLLGWGAKGLGALFGGGLGDATLDERERELEQRHQDEIAYQFGTGEEPTWLRAQRLDRLNKARARARTVGAEATFGPEYGMRQETLPVPPLPVGAEATFGPEYGMRPPLPLGQRLAEASVNPQALYPGRTVFAGDGDGGAAVPPVQPGLGQIPAADLQALAAAHTRQAAPTLRSGYVPPGFGGPIGGGATLGPGYGMPQETLSYPAGRRGGVTPLGPEYRPLGLTVGAPLGGGPTLGPGASGLSAALAAVPDQWDFKMADVHGQYAKGGGFGAPDAYEGGPDVFGFRLGTPPPVDIPDFQPSYSDQYFDIGITPEALGLGLGR